VATARTETERRQTFTGSLQAKTAEPPEQLLQTINREGEPERHTQQQQSGRHRPLRFVFYFAATGVTRPHSSLNSTLSKKADAATTLPLRSSRNHA